MTGILFPTARKYTKRENKKHLNKIINTAHKKGKSTIRACVIEKEKMMESANGTKWSETEKRK